MEASGPARKLLLFSPKPGADSDYFRVATNVPLGW